jgi:tetratricopeptide (TPR) repeat protein
MIRKSSLLFGISLLLPVVVWAQAPKNDALKRVPPPAPMRPSCAPVPAPATPTDAQRRRARDLANNGRQAAILGDSAAAFAQMREASQLNPTDADLAYQLARAYETAGSTANAAKEYCRFLAIAPNAPEAGEARARVAVLAPPTTVSGPTVASTLFDAAVAAYDRKQLAEAEAKFGSAITAEPTWADSYYDRALVRLAQGDPRRAQSDLEEYLRLKPQASDRAQVVARIETLRQRPISPGQALGLGLIVPGGGQFYTRRPIRGALFLAGAAAAIGFAVQTQSSTKTVEETATDPFGNPYKFTTTHRVTDRPNLIPGIAAASALIAGSAFEAFVFAKHRSIEVQRVTMSVSPRGGGVAARVSLQLR